MIIEFGKKEPKQDSLAEGSEDKKEFSIAIMNDIIWKVVKSFFFGGSRHSRI
jgi:hypothetical protein